MKLHRILSGLLDLHRRVPWLEEDVSRLRGAVVDVLEIEAGDPRLEQIPALLAMSQGSHAAVALAMSGQHLVVHSLVVHEHGPDAASLQHNIGLVVAKGARGAQEEC